MLRNILIGVLSCGMIAFCGGDLYSAPSSADSPFIYPEYSKKISMDFQDASLIDVLKIFSKQTNLNLISSADLSSKRITIYLDNVPVEQALEQLLRANSLTYELQPGSDIYIVKPLSQPEQELLTRVYFLKHASVASSKILQTLSISSGGSSEESSSSSSGSSSSGSSAGSTIGKSNSGGQENGINAVITAVLTPRGKLTEDPRTNSMVITDIATNFPEIERAIARLDIPMAEILIEVEMLEVSKTAAEKVGIKYGDTPLTFQGAQRLVVYPWDQNDLLSKGYVFEDPEYTAGMVDASGMTAALQFLRTESDTKSLARPRILTLNNEVAQIKISTDEAIGVKSSSQSTTGTQSLEAERMPTGVFLTVTPQANLATNEITMAIVPKVIITRTGGTFQGTTFRDPEERGTQSILRVKSGDTIVIGGLMRTDNTKTVTKLPILGDIPFIGGAFRHRDETNREKELIIFITPRIMPSRSGSDPAAILTGGPLKMREQDVPFQNKKMDEIEKEIVAVEKSKP